MADGIPFLHWMADGIPVVHWRLDGIPVVHWLADGALVVHCLADGLPVVRWLSTLFPLLPPRHLGHSNPRAVSQPVSWHAAIRNGKGPACVEAEDATSRRILGTDFC